MALVFNHGSLITVDGNAVIDVDLAGGLPQSHCDLAVVGIGNFASGNYTQKSGDVNDIVSNFTLSSTTIVNAGFYLTTPTAVSLTNFGTAVHATSDNLEITSKTHLGNHHTGSNRDWFGNLQTMQGNKSNISTGTKLKAGGANGSAGAVLVQAAAAALFKKLGKHAALNNDKAISLRQKPMANEMGNAWVESSANYTDSQIFKRYLESGRYADDGADVNTVVNYNLTSTSYDFIVQLSGNVSDAGNDTLNLVKILGDFNANPKETKVKEDGSYKFNVYMRLQHETDV